MELPEELMTLILLKLPAKSLLRFKSVKKSWYSLINSPYFIHLYRSSKIKENDCLIVRRHYLERDVLCLHSYETLDDLGNQINLPSSFVGRVDLCGSCDGLVCLSNYVDQILLCNPTIREFRSLFVPPCVRSGYRIESVAFGSNPNTGQYTAVMIGVSTSDYAHFDDDIYDDRDAWLYNFITDTWRKTDVVVPGPFHYWHCAVSLNGAFHWCTTDYSSNILTFHMSNEVTEKIPMPDFAQVGRVRDKELCVSSESQLSLVLYDFEGQFEICVMTEYGVKESWTRIFRIGPLPLNFHQPIAFWDEQRLILTSAQGQLVSCDLQNHQNLLHFPIAGEFDLSPYSQSLVSVFGIEHSII